MMAQVDERLKRRFSVSTSMEEISKIAEMKNIGSQVNINNPEQAALAQSQHFDQLEALWNKRSPPRRRMNQVKLSLKASLRGIERIFFFSSRFLDSPLSLKIEFPVRMKTNSSRSVPEVRIAQCRATLFDQIHFHKLEHAAKTHLLNTAHLPCQ